MKLLSVLLFIIIATTILLISILIAPNQLNNYYFWLTVGWLIFLSGVNWIVSTFIFIGAASNSESRNYGILPSLNILVFIYSLISSFFLLSTWFIFDFNILPNWHLITQIILFFIVSSITILMFISSKAANIESSSDITLSKEELLNKVKEISNLVIDENHKNLLKELSEIINYSMPHISKLNSKNDYNQLCAKVIELSKKNQKIDKDILSKLIIYSKNS